MSVRYYGDLDRRPAPDLSEFGIGVAPTYDEDTMDDYYSTDYALPRGAIRCAAQGEADNGSINGGTT